MSFDLDLEGIEAFRVQLTRLAEIPNLANEELKACAQEVAQKAKNMAPYEYMDLIDSIQVGRRGVQGAGGRFVSGMSNYDVFINLNHPTHHEDAPSGTVRDYAWEVHEHMGYGSTPGTIYIKGKPFMPNPQRSRGPNGEERGGHFIDRALEDLRDGIYARINRKVLDLFK